MAAILAVLLNFVCLFVRRVRFESGDFDISQYWRVPKRPSSADWLDKRRIESLGREGTEVYPTEMH